MPSLSPLHAPAAQVRRTPCTADGADPWRPGHGERNGPWTCHTGPAGAGGCRRIHRGFSCREVARIVRCRQPPWCARSLQPAARWPNRGPEAARRGPSGDGHPAQGGGAPSLRTWRGGDPCPIRTAAGVRCPGARARARTSAQARPAGEPTRQARPPRAPNAQARPPMGPNCVVGRERFAGAALSYWHPHRASGHHPGCASSACRFGPDPRGAALTGFRPSPTSHASLGPVSGQAHAGLTVRVTDRRRPLADGW